MADQTPADQAPAQQEKAVLLKDLEEKYNAAAAAVSRLNAERPKVEKQLQDQFRKEFAKSKQHAALVDFDERYAKAREAKRAAFAAWEAAQ